MLHIPILRRGQPYRSVEVCRTPNMRTGEPFVEISQANVGLIRRDLLKQAESRAALDAFSTRELLDICRRAADIFANDTLPLGDTPQTPQDYVEQLSATTGLPYVLVRNNMARFAASWQRWSRCFEASLARCRSRSPRSWIMRAASASSRELIRSASFFPTIRPACIRSGFPRSR